MARHNSPAPDNARVKIRVLEFDVEGGNATILEGIKQLASVIQRNANGAHAGRVARDGSVAQEIALNGSQDSGEQQDEVEQEVIDPVAAAAPRRPAAPRKIRPLEIVQGINFNAGVPLKQFVESYNLDSKMKKYTAVAAWFKQHANIPEISANHIYTAFKSLGWGGLGRNAAGPLQDLTNKQDYKWFNAGGTKGNYAINYIGEQKLEEWRKAA